MEENRFKQRSEDSSIKTIVPIKGNLLEKLKQNLKKKLHQKNETLTLLSESNDTINNNQNGERHPVNKNSMFPSESKVIIHTVETVHIDVSSILQNDSIIQNEHFDENTNHASKVEPLQDKSSIKILSAKMPENDCNKLIPLKMVRKIRQPKPMPNLQRKRFGNVQIHNDLSAKPEQEALPMFSIKVLQEPLDVIQIIENKPKSPFEEEFKGFSDKDISIEDNDKLKLWRECLKSKNNKNVDETLTNESISPQITQAQAQSLLNNNDQEQQPFKTQKLNLNGNKRATKVIKEEDSEMDISNVLSESQTEVISQVITDSMVNSSMMREFADELEDSNEKDISEKSSDADFDEEMEESDDDDDENQSEIMDTDEAHWLINDVSDLIGEARIREIDMSLKKIPSIACGNKIETENIELKLIINHLLKKLNAQTVAETLDSDSPCIENNLNEIINTSQDDEAENNDDYTSDHFEDDFTNNEHNFKEEDDKPTTSTTVLLMAPDEIDFSLMPETHEIPLDSFQEDIQEDEIEDITIVQEIVKTEDLLETPKEIKIQSTLKRTQELMPLASSTVKKMRLSPILSDGSQKSEGIVIGSIKGKRGRPAKKAQLEKIKEVEKTQLENRANVGRGRSKRIQSMVKKSPSPSPPPIKIIKTHDEGPDRTRSSKPLVSDCDVFEKSSVSNAIDELKLSAKNDDFNSRLHPPPNDNSNDDYLNSPSSSPDLDINKKQEKGVIGKSDPIFKEVVEIVDKKKNSDPTFREPENSKKRPYLISSAFNGNQENATTTTTTTIDHMSSDSSQSSSDDSNSVSDDSVTTPSLSIQDTTATGPKSLKDVMNSLIYGKSLLTINKSKGSVKVKKKKRKMPIVVVKRRRETIVHPKRIFQQESLEKAINSLVPYDDIIESIRVSNPPRGKKSGKAKWSIPKLTEAEKKKIRKELEKLKYFKCGICQFLVTKHKWKEHLELHGCFAYIDGYEDALDILDYNESLRRMMHYARIYSLTSFKCPHCNDVKKSVLGQLCHSYVCGEDPDVVETRKVQCEHCEVRVMPYSLSMHKKSCKGLIFEKKEEELSDIEDSIPAHLSVRRKRKAVVKAEKKFKSIINDEEEEHIGTVDENGESQCYLCGENFTTKEYAIDHLEKDHDIKKEEKDFGSSSSDEFENKDESSESESSSDVDEKDEQSDDGGGVGGVEEDGDDNESNINLSGRQPTVEPQEARNARNLVQGYLESLRQDHKLSNKIIDLTQNFITGVLSPEIFPLAIPKFKLSHLDLPSFLTRINFETKSMHFHVRESENYTLEEKSVSKEEWQQIEVGSQYKSNNHTQVFYCGGSVSSIDWAPSNNDKNFMAVACNRDSEIKMGLVQTTRSCVQIYEFQSLVNDKFHNFDSVSSSLLYAFAINDGPILSLKFHPCGSPSYERIGILAVTTSQQDVHVYSLPYLNSSKVVVPEPLFICRLSEETIFHHDNFLLQATRVNWHYQKNFNNILAAGYVNGYIALWNLKGKQQSTTKLPNIVIQAHNDSITSIDTKVGTNGQFFLLTASLERIIKIYSIQKSHYEELAVFNPTSRTFCAQFLLNWPAFIIGNDSCYAPGNLMLRQPFEFANRNITLMNAGSSIIDLDSCNWSNSILFTTESGDVMGCHCKHLINNNSIKDRWQSFRNSIYSFTDYKIIPTSQNSNDKYGLIFNDIISNFTKKPKKFRDVPAELTNQLQINQVCFNRNKKSHRFYALAYETGFVRIKYLKNLTK